MNTLQDSVIRKQLIEMAVSGFHPDEAVRIVMNQQGMTAAEVIAADERAKQRVIDAHIARGGKVAA